ncbi:uncharacterized protein LOC119652414 isoform X2 [Hermetia illucens]|uniref:uncharacterized protein LOC119652414 isoform X2 n=1 Tax=Hermetia illucens TaxID=343691 RepID=UPI0018CC35DC|nr:uncharacterized protein LOC119652414 isoform X2 [Hermetia illucens]
MQAALMLRSSQRIAKRRKLRKLGRLTELPSNIATKEIAPFPRFPPESWCAQGRAAWLERGRRCSVQNNNPASCHRRWVKRNRIQDSSLGGSSDDEDLLGVLRGPSSFANAFLYVGLGTVAIGLVIAFVGTGEKGFKTVELRLIGPSLIGLGLICCILRICFCICPSSCLSKNKKSRKKDINKIDADHTTSLLRGESKRVSIATKGSRNKFPLGGKSRANSKMLNEGMEALRQIATTSLFLQNEPKPPTNRIVPIIKEPEKQAEAPLEMRKLETILNISDVTDDEDEDEAAATTSSYQNQSESLVKSESKLARQRLPTHQGQTQPKCQEKPSKANPDNLQMETSLMVVNPTPSTSTGKSSSLSPQPCTSRVALDLPLEKRQFLPPQVPLVHTPPLGTSSAPVPYARPGPSSSTRSPPSTSATSSSGSHSAPVAGHSRNLTINSNIKTATTTNTTHTTIVEPELVLSPAKLGQ